MNTDTHAPSNRCAGSLRLVLAMPNSCTCPNCGQKVDTKHDYGAFYRIVVHAKKGR